MIIINIKFMSKTIDTWKDKTATIKEIEVLLKPLIEKEVPEAKHHDRINRIAVKGVVKGYEDMQAAILENVELKKTVGDISVANWVIVHIKNFQDLAESGFKQHILYMGSKPKSIPIFLKAVRDLGKSVGQLSAFVEFVVVEPVGEGLEQYKTRIDETVKEMARCWLTMYTNAGICTHNAGITEGPRPDFKPLMKRFMQIANKAKDEQKSVIQVIVNQLSRFSLK